MLGLRDRVQRRARGGHEQQSEAEAERHQQRERAEALERHAGHREHAQRGRATRQEAERRGLALAAAVGEPPGDGRRHRTSSAISVSAAAAPSAE